MIAERDFMAGIPLGLVGGRYQMQMANELAGRIAKVREMLASMEDEAKIQKDAIKDLKDREHALVNELLFCLTEE